MTCSADFWLRPLESNGKRVPARTQHSCLFADCLLVLCIDLDAIQRTRLLIRIRNICELGYGDLDASLDQAAIVRTFFAASLELGLNSRNAVVVHECLENSWSCGASMIYPAGQYITLKLMICIDCFVSSFRRSSNRDSCCRIGCACCCY